MNRILWCLTGLIIFAVSLAYAQDDTLKSADLISKCLDLSSADLKTEAKTELINAIYDRNYKNDVSSLRYVLGQICFDNKEFNCAKEQWNIILADYPNSSEASLVKTIFGMLGWLYVDYYKDFEFMREYELSSYFWRPVDPDYRINPEELLDPVLAVSYLEYLLGKYEDHNKKAVILYDMFKLLMGYNNDVFGYHADCNCHPQEPCAKYYKNVIGYDPLDNCAGQLKQFFFSKASAISDSLKNIDISNSYYINTQFLLGVSMCGNKLLSSKIKIKKEAVPYFEEVIKYTENQETNIYRIFAIKWLSELKK